MPNPIRTCVGCRLPLAEGPRSRVIANRPRPPVEWYTCEACEQPAPVGVRPYCLPPPEPGERRLFTVNPAEPAGIVIAINPSANRAQIVAWDRALIRTVVWTGTYQQVRILLYGKP